MEIRTITCHNVYNYGASLQAFALQTYLESQGHKVKIIDYRPSYLDIHYRLSTFISRDLYVYKPRLKKWYIKYPFVIYRYLISLKDYSRKRAFDKFKKQYYHLTSKYKNISDLKKEIYSDVYIAGSDQIWNSVFMENGKDPAFYLDFVPDNKIKISYAASFGANDIDRTYALSIKGYLERFDAISIREKSGIDILDSLGIKSHLVCDPVFLLNKQQWESFCFVPKISKYVLIYNIGSIDQNIVDKAMELVNLYKFKVISIKDKNNISEANENLEDVGPIEFISYIKNAEFILSNSFHATAFSLILKKQFYTFQFTDLSNSSRMINLLNLFNLNDRFNPVLNSPINNIDYHNICNLTDTFAEQSRSWLNKAIGSHE